MTKGIFLFLLLSIPLVSFSQSSGQSVKRFKTKTGIGHSSANFLFTNALVGTPSEGYALIRADKKIKTDLPEKSMEHGALRGNMRGAKVEVDRITPKLSLTATERLRFESSVSGREVELFFQLGEKTLFISSKLNETLNVLDLFLQRYNPVSGKMMSVSERMGSVKLTGVAPTDAHFFNVTKAADNSYFVVHYMKETGGRTVAGFMMIGAGGNGIMLRETPLPFDKDQMELEQTILTKDRRILMLIKKYRDHHGKVAGEEFEYIVLETSRTEKDFREIPLTTAWGKVENARLAVGKDGQVIGIARYKGSHRGICYLKQKDKKAFEAITEDPFQKEFVGKSKDSKTAENLKFAVQRGDLDYVIAWRNIHVLADGSIYAVGEENNPYVTKNSGGTNFLYSDLVVYRFDAEGKLLWKESLPKKQEGSGAEKIFLSFDSFVANDQLYVIYNDHPKNLKPIESQVHAMALSEKEVIVMAEFKEDGTIYRQKVNGYSRSETFLVPGFHFYEDAENHIFLTRDGKSIKLMRIVILDEEGQ